MEKMEAYGAPKKSAENSSVSDGETENKKMKRGGRA